MSSGSFTHDAVVYDDDAVAIDAIADAVRRGVHEHARVLACLPTRLEEHVRALSAGNEDQVVFQSIDQRYARPVDAVKALWAFTHDSLAQGARSVISIGELPVGAHTASWCWYEHAVNDVFGALPLQAVCLLDSRQVQANTLDCMLAAHRPAATTPPMPIVEAPPGPATRALKTDVPAQARAMIADVALPLGEDFVATAKLIVSELVTNSVLHGRAAPQVSAWRSDDKLVIEVVDDGVGLTDTAIALRPPQLPDRGTGVWLCHQLADAFSIGPAPQGGTLARAELFAHTTR